MKKKKKKQKRRGQWHRFPLCGSIFINEQSANIKNIFYCVRISMFNPVTPAPFSTDLVEFLEGHTPVPGRYQRVKHPSSTNSNIFIFLYILHSLVLCGYLLFIRKLAVKMHCEFRYSKLSQQRTAVISDQKSWLHLWYSPLFKEVIVFGGPLVKYPCKQRQCNNDQNY